MGKAKRISGQDMAEAGGVPFAVEADGKWRMDLTAIQSHIGAYLEEAAGTGRYSISGLCIALGITREALRLWRMGYVSVADEQSVRVLPNAALAEAVAKAELYVQRFWEECDESKMQSKHTKLLESAGVMGEGARRAPATAYDLGRLKRYGR
jgi:hypothetical protein